MLYDDSTPRHGEARGGRRAASGRGLRMVEPLLADGWVVWVSDTMSMRGAG
jgi:hypothetical protein